MLHGWASIKALAWLVAATCLLVACTEGTQTAPPGAREDTRRTSQGPPQGPSRGAGSVAFGVIGEPATYDPYAALASDLTYALVRPVYPSLYRLEPDGAATPYLAKSMSSTRKGAVVALRRARWSNGAPITAKDVVASIRRARPPSGFALVTEAQADGRRKIRLSGRVNDWKQTLATVAFVLPRGRAGSGRVAGGPFMIEARTPGLQVVYRPNPRWFGHAPALKKVTVQFIQDLDILLELLARERLDAGAPPLTVNLGGRLESLGLASAGALGWESVYLDLEGAELSASNRQAVVDGVDRDLLEAGFVRAGGRVSDTLHPAPGPSGAAGPWPGPTLAAPQPPAAPIQVAVGAGDELTELLQRTLRLQLEDAGFSVELVTTDALTFYGQWTATDPMDIAIRRASGAPGLVDTPAVLESRAAIPLLHVASFVTWNEGIEGPEPNPSFEGPLWNLELWSKQ